MVVYMEKIISFTRLDKEKKAIELIDYNLDGGCNGERLHGYYQIRCKYGLTFR